MAKVRRDRVSVEFAEQIVRFAIREDVARIRETGHFFRRSFAVDFLR